MTDVPGAGAARESVLHGGRVRRGVLGLCLLLVLPGCASVRTLDAAKPGAPMDDYERYNYAALEAEAKKLKEGHKSETVVTISAENSVPMQVLVSTMDAARGVECRLVPFLDGTVEEHDMDAWMDAGYELTDAPEDYSGSLDMEREDFATDRGEVHPEADYLGYADRAD